MPPKKQEKRQAAIRQADVSDKSPVSHVFQRPGIPVATEQQRVHWIVWWVVAASFLFLSVPVFKYVFFYHDEIIFEQGVPIDLSIITKGCDVDITAVANGQSFLDVSFWTFMGEALITRESNKDHNKLKVFADVSQRLMSLRCQIHVKVNEKDEKLLNSIYIKTGVDAASVQSASNPSNMADEVIIDLEGIWVGEQIEIFNAAAAHIRVSDVHAPKLTATLDTSKLEVSERGGGKIPSDIILLGRDAVAIVHTQTVDLNVGLNENAQPYSVLAATSQGSKSEKVDAEGLFQYKLHVGNQVGTKSATVIGKMLNGPIYAMAANAEHRAGYGKDLATARGSKAQVPELTADTVDQMKKLVSYLAVPSNDQKFAAYFEIVAPHSPVGSLRLLSTASYIAFSVDMFTIISAGMMSPKIIKMQLPIVASKALFPRCSKDGLLSEEESLEWVSSVFHVLQAVVPIDNEELKLPNSLWIWDPVGPATWIFDRILYKHGKPPTWRMRALNYKDTWQFSFATGITLFVGISVGIAVYWGIYAILRPKLWHQLRELSMFNTASYKLIHTPTSHPWTLVGTFVQWPIPGVMLRWNHRDKTEPLMDNVSVKARPWPLNPGSKEVKVQKIVIQRLPRLPALPDQQVFLFVQQPRQFQPKIYSSLLDTQLEAVAALQASGEPLVVGKSYQFKIIAYKDAASTAVVEQSSWSRPTMIQNRRAFTEYPLLLWKSYLGIIPSDTLSYFLNKHTIVGDSPSLQVCFDDYSLAIANDAPLFAPVDDQYGAQQNRYVQVIASTDNGMFEYTHKGLLPQKREKSVKWDQLVPNAGSGTVGLEGADFYKVPFHLRQTKNTVRLTMTPGDVESCVTIQALPSTDSAEGEQSARLTLSWRELLMICSHAENGEITDEIILRDGLTPCAVFQAKVTMANTVLGAASAKKQGSMLNSIIPGFTYIWGEKVELTWKKAKAEKEKSCAHVDMVLVAEYFNRRGTSEAKKGDPLAVYGKDELKTESVVSLQTPVSALKQVVMMAPHLPVQVQRMRCWVEARNSSNFSEVVSRSGDFIIIRPVTLSDLELAYSTFCIRNAIPMQTVTYGGITSYGVILVQKSMHVCTGYRRLLPIPSEAGQYPSSIPFDPNGGQPVVEWGPSQVITNGRPLEVKDTSQPPNKGDDSSTPKQKSPTKSSTKGTLVEPLLESGAKEPAVETRTIPVSTEEILLPVNVFWKYEVDFLPECLLWYALMPSWAQQGYITAYISSLGGGFATVADKYAFIFKSGDNFVNAALVTSMYLIQILLLVLPALMISVFWLWHDTLMATINPNVRPIDTRSQDFFDNAVFSPSLYCWSNLRVYGLVIYFVCWAYLLMVASATFYCNFIASSRHHNDKLFHWINLGMEVCVAVFVFFLVVYVAVVAVWCLMGALIDPEKLLPYAIMIIAVIAVSKGAWGKLTEMKNFVEGKISAELDNALEALMCLFSDHRDDKSETEIQAVASQFKKNAMLIVKYMEEAEQETIDELAKAATKNFKKKGIIAATQQEDMEAGETPMTSLGTFTSDQIVGRMVAAEQKISDLLAKASTIKRDKLKQIVAEDTDKANTACLTTPRQISNEEVAVLMEIAERKIVEDLTTTALIEGGTVGETDKEVKKKQRQQRAGDATIQKPGTFTSDDVVFIKNLAGNISLSENCASEVARAYSHLLAGASVQNEAEAKIMVPESISKLMVKIRKEQLFAHFKIYEEDGDKTSDAIKFVKEMFHKELGNLDSVVATCLTKLLDWTIISRSAAKYTSSNTQVIMAREIENQLDPVLNGSAACTLMLNVFMKVNAPVHTGTAGSKPCTKFQAVYRRDPLEAFVDCGIIDSQMKKNPPTKAIVTAVVDAQRDFDGNLDSEALKTAMQNMCIPPPSGSAPLAEDQTGVVTYYLWFEGLQAILKMLGFTPDEMDKLWLMRQWMVITENKGLFDYRDISEINGVIAQLTGGGLWKAAMKALLLDIRIGGYVCCDSSKMKPEKCGDLAREVQRVDPESYRKIAKLCQWPDYVEGIWEGLAETVDLSKGPVQSGPKFLRLDKIENFLEALLYIRVDENTARMMTFTPLNAYPTDGLDLQWQYGTDGAVWHIMGKKTPKRLRGMWLELLLDVCKVLDCLPSDVDIYYECLEWQSKMKERHSPALHLEFLKSWLETAYVTDITSCTSAQFCTLMNVYLGIDVEEAILKLQIFLQCPKVAGDDQGELRHLSDLGYAFSIWLGDGLWSKGIASIVGRLVPRGNMRNLALAALPDAIAKVDSTGTGCLKPGQTLLVLRQVLNPGLTERNLKSFLENDLQLAMIPEAELHKYFTMMDINGDGVLTLGEFIPTVRFLMTGFFPRHICRTMNLTTAQILKFVAVVMLNLVGLFIFITLVIQTFTAGTGISSILHSGLSAFGGLASKLQSDGNSGAVADVVAAATFVENMVRDRIIAVLGLTKTAADKLIGASKRIV